MKKLFTLLAFTLLISCNKECKDQEDAINQEYIEALNAGHSRQAPSGFLDMIAEKASLTLDAALTQLVDAL